jgi:Family of unknown function (DUF6496)
MKHHMEHRDEHGRHSPAKSSIARKMRGESVEKKIGHVMGEFKHHELHSGSKHGPLVKSRAQALAIGESEAREHKGKKHHGKHHGKHHEKKMHEHKKHHGKHHLSAKKREHEHMEKKKRHEKE